MTATQTDDASQLAELGYESRFERRMGLWENFALGFTYLSPVVGVYPWARRLIGRRWAWITGWIYGWALIATVASVSTGAVPFIGSLFGFTPNRTTTVIVAAALMLIALLVNLSGTKTLGRVAMAGFVAELIGALFVGLWLLLFERHHDFGVLFDSLGTGGNGSYTSEPSLRPRCSACTCSTASRPAATSPRRCPTRARRSRRRCAARSTSAAPRACSSPPR
jgi:hypothetical protein